LFVSPFFKFSPTTAFGAPYRASQYCFVPYTLAVVLFGRWPLVAGFVGFVAGDDDASSGAARAFSAGERIGSSSEASESDAVKRASAATLSSSSFLTASFARSASSFALEERCSAADAADNVIAKVVEPVGLDLAIARLKWVERSRR
jgi:hypothetical protein